MKETITLTIVLTPCTDPVCVVAEVLEFGLVTQGEDRLHALAMALEVSQMIVEDDRGLGLDPFDRAIPDVPDGGSET